MEVGGVSTKQRPPQAPARGVLSRPSAQPVQDPVFRDTIARVAPPGFIRIPASFRELEPSYRAAHPDGVARGKRSNIIR